MLKINTFADANKASVDTLFGMSSQALQVAEQLAALNLQAIKTSTAEFAQLIQAALSAKSPTDLVDMQTAALQAAPQKALGYATQVKEIFAATAAGLRSAVEAQVADVQAKFLEAVNGLLNNIPGSESALALVKSAVAAANNAYDGMNKASKQVFDAVDANVTEVAETGLQTSRRSLATTDDGAGTK